MHQSIHCTAKNRRRGGHVHSSPCVTTIRWPTWDAGVCNATSVNDKYEKYDFVYTNTWCEVFYACILCYKVFGLQVCGEALDLEKWTVQ